MKKNPIPSNYISEHTFPTYSPSMVIGTILLCLCIFTGAWEGLRQDELVQPIADKILRFRVLANSNSPEDQEVKLTVRDEILTYLSTQGSDATTSDDLERFVAAHINDLEMLASGIVSEHGTPYPVHITLGECYFPEKTYGSLTFPRGTYRALKVEIGAAKGANWWCVLYPELCFTDAVTAVVPEESQQELRGVLSEDEYQILENDIEIRFRFIDLLSRWFQ